MSKIIPNLLALIIFAMSFAAVAKYEGKRPGHRFRKMRPPLTAEQHDKIAALHSQAATCIRSGKSEKECGKELRQAKREITGHKRRGPRPHMKPADKDSKSEDSSSEKDN